MKIYLIGLYDYKEDFGDAQCIVKATTSFEAAKQYVLDSIKKYDANNDFRSYEVEANYCWDFYYTLKDGNKNIKCELTYRIEPMELIDTEDIQKIKRPELEKRCEALEKHNDELKKEIAELKKNNSAAQCYLTFWDGGKYEDLDHVLSNVYTAREILQGGEKGNNYILELFEGWKKSDNSL